MRLRRLAPPLLAALLACAAPAQALRATSLADAQAALAAFPESNPYRAVLLRYTNLTDEDRKAINDWTDASDARPADQPAPTLTAAQSALVAEFSAALRDAAKAPRLTAEDWPLLPNPKDPDNPAAILIPTVGPMRQLARIAVRQADDLPAGEALDIYAAVARLGRQQRAGATLIEQLTGVAIEGIAQAGPARRLAEFSAEDLRRLSEAWLSLPPAPDHTHAVSGERDLFFRPIVEDMLLPGLREMLASGTTAEELFTGADKPTTADFTRDLRLSGLADLGGGERRVILENTRDGHSITLRPGSPVEGIELVSLDFEKRLAVIRSGSTEAVIHLESKRIVPRKSASARLREFFAGFDIFGEKGTGRTALEKALARARAHPDGAEGYARELLDTYQTGIDRQVALAASARYPENLGPTETEKADPLLALTMPTIGRVIRVFNGSATSGVMLQAAIQHRLGELGHDHAGIIPDPWASTKDRSQPFQTERLPGGGFILRSAYETADRAPYTYKFAAPDAGFIRVQPQK